MNYNDDPFFSQDEEIQIDYANDPFFSQPQVDYRAIDKYVEDRGFLGDTATYLGRGSLSAIELASHAFQTITGKESSLDEWAGKTREEVDFFKPDRTQYYGKEGYVKDKWNVAMESLAPSLAGALPGAAIGSFLPVVGTIGGAIIGGVLGSAGLFGAGTYGKTSEELKALGTMSEEDIHAYSLKEAFIEGGIESLATGAEIITAGGAKLFTRPLTSTLKGLLKTTGKDVASAYGKTMAVEVSTEMLQAGLSSENARDYGIETEGLIKSMSDAVLPAVFMSGIFSTIGQGYSAKQRSAIRKGLEAKNPNAISIVHKELLKQDKELAAGFKEYSNEILSDPKLTFDLNKDLVNLFDRVKVAESTRAEKVIEDPLASTPEELEEAVTTSLQEKELPEVDTIFKAEMNLIDQITPERAMAMKGSPLLNDKITEMSRVLGDTEFQIWSNKLKGAMSVAYPEFKKEQMAQEAYTPSEVPGEAERAREARETELQLAAEEILRRPLKDKLKAEEIPLDRQVQFEKIVLLKAQQTQIAQAMRQVEEESNNVAVAKKKVKSTKNLKDKVVAKAELKVAEVILEEKKAEVAKVEKVAEETISTIKDEELKVGDKVTTFEKPNPISSMEIARQIEEDEKYKPVEKEGFKVETEIAKGEQLIQEEAIAMAEERAELPQRDTESVDLDKDIDTVSTKATTGKEKKGVEKIPYIKWDTQADQSGKTGEGVNGVVYVAKVNERVVQDKGKDKTIKESVSITGIDKDGKVVSEVALPASKNIWNKVDTYVEKEVANSKEGKELRAKVLGERKEEAAKIIEEKQRKGTVKSTVRRRKGEKSVLKSTKVMDFGTEKQDRKLGTWTREVKGVPVSIQNTKDGWENKDTGEVLGKTRGEAWDAALGDQAPFIESFHSRLKDTISTKGPKSATPVQWLTTLKQWKVKGTLPIPVQEELEWSGLEDILEDSDKSVKITKEDVLSYLDEKAVDIVEGIKSREDNVLPPEYTGDKDNWSTNEQGFTEITDKGGHLVTGSYIYNREGNEVPFSLTIDGDWKGDFGTLDEAIKEAGSYAITIGEVQDQTSYSDYTLPREGTEGEVENYREVLWKIPGIGFSNSSHFRDKDYFLHARIRDDVDSDGNKVLFVEEIQSDLHQKAQGKGGVGYRKKGDDTLDREFVEDKERLSVMKRALFDLKSSLEKIEVNEGGRGTILSLSLPYIKENRNHLWEMQTKAFKDGFKKLSILKDDVLALKKSNRELAFKLAGRSTVPNTPFKKSWTLLAMKRLTAMAAEQGYDKIAWTTGEQQVKRWGPTGPKNYYNKTLPQITKKFVSKYGSKIEVSEIQGEKQLSFKITDEMVDTTFPLYEPAKIAKGEKEEITGLQLLERTISDPNVSKETKALALALTTNATTRNKLRKTPVRVGNVDRSITIGGKEIEMASTERTFSNVHEAVHALTVREMRANPEIKKDVIALMELARKEAVAQGLFTQDQMNEISKDIRSQWNEDGEWYQHEEYTVSYGLRNEREFLAQTFGSQNFRNFLEEIELPKEQQTGLLKTMWDKFVAITFKALGLSKKNYTALHKALKLTMELGTSEVSSAAVGKRDEAFVVKPKGSRVGGVLIRRRGDEAPLEITGNKAPLETLTANRDEPIVSKVSTFLSGSTDVLKNIAMVVTEQLRYIEPKLIRFLRKMELAISDSNVKYHDQIKPFMKFYENLNNKDQMELSWALKNTDDEAMAIRKRILGSEYKAVEGVLKDIHSRMEAVGLNTYSSIPEYFPRRVKDMDGLMRYLRVYADKVEKQEELGRKLTEKEKEEGVQARENLSRLEEALLQAKDAKGDKLTKLEREDVVNKTIHTGKTNVMAFNVPGSAKQRMVSRVNPEMDKFYYDSIETLVDHIYKSNEAIETRAAFNFTNRKKLVAEGNRIARSREPDTERLAEIEKDLQAIDEDQTESLSSFLSDKGLSFPAEKQLEVIKLLRARLNQTGTHGAISSLRDAMLITTLSSPTSAITQLQDLAWSIYYNGPINTASSIFGNRRMSKKEFDLERSMKDFNNGSSKWVDKALKYSGLQMMDLFGKEVFMESTFKRVEGMSRGTFIEKNAFKFDSEEIAGEVWDKINDGTARDKDGVWDQEVKFFIFNELSNSQPITLSEMPPARLLAGNGAIFYTLKTYQIKQMNNLIREIRTAKNPKEAMLKFGTLASLLILAGASADEIKDLIMGRTNTFGDHVYENMLKLGFLSKYNTSKGPGTKSIKSFLTDILVPPVNFIGDPMEDFYKLVQGEASYETLKDLPWGAPVYSRFTEKGKEKSLRNERMDLMEDFKNVLEDGGNVSKIRSRIESYNQKSDDKIKYARTRSYLLRKIGEGE